MPYHCSKPEHTRSLLSGGFDRGDYGENVGIFFWERAWQKRRMVLEETALNLLYTQMELDGLSALLRAHLGGSGEGLFERLQQLGHGTRPD